MTATGRPLVIAYGNRLRGDDAVGWVVADALRDDVRMEAVDVLAVHQLTPELAIEVADASLVIFVDARIDAGLAPGDIAINTVVKELDAGPMTHHVGAGTILALADALYGAHPIAVAVSVAIESVEPGADLCASSTTRSPGSSRLSVGYARRLPMHEFSLVQELVEAIEQRAAGRNVAVVVVRHATTISEDSVRQAFSMLTADGPLARTALTCEQFEVTLRCEMCGFAGALDHEHLAGHVRVCPHCGAISGDSGLAEMELMAVVTD